MSNAIKSNPEVATTILNQLGGQRFVAMVGAKDMGYSSNSLSMKIMRNAKKVTHVTITYDHGKDLYKMTFSAWNARKFEFKVLEEVDGVFFDQMKEIFESNTGLYTSLF